MIVEYPVGKYTDKIKEILGAETEVQDWLHIAGVYDFEERMNIVIYVWDTREIREVLTFPYNEDNKNVFRRVGWYFNQVKNGEFPKAIDNLKDTDFAPTAKPSNPKFKKAVRVINQMFEQIRYRENCDIKNALEVIKYGKSQWSQNKFAFELLKTKKVQEFIDNELDIEYNGNLREYVKEVIMKLAEW